MHGRPSWGSAVVIGLAGFATGLLVAALLVAGRPTVPSPQVSGPTLLSSTPVVPITVTAPAPPATTVTDVETSPPVTSTTLVQVTVPPPTPSTTTPAPTPTSTSLVVITSQD
ncbi:MULTISPECIES: hypothetical protein [unclassified Amycolatopsis]|uniref:hypothetical protein n=1 Tax=unclassified Amycolatopsis TaxID=2618356 RepID=UPI002E1F98F7|nr:MULTISPECIES: hypothetical protein [unclassified Amycolatopsis]